MLSKSDYFGKLHLFWWYCPCCVMSLEIIFWSSLQRYIYGIRWGRELSVIFPKKTNPCKKLSVKINSLHLPINRPKSILSSDGIIEVSERSIKISPFFGFWAVAYGKDIRYSSVFLSKTGKLNLSLLLCVTILFPLIFISCDPFLPIH